MEDELNEGNKMKGINTRLYLFMLSQVFRYNKIRFKNGERQ